MSQRLSAKLFFKNFFEDFFINLLENQSEKVEELLLKQNKSFCLTFTFILKELLFFAYRGCKYKYAF